jgi:hypothetical protein
MIVQSRVAVERLVVIAVLVSNHGVRVAWVGEQLP